MKKQLLILLALALLVASCQGHHDGPHHEDDDDEHEKEDRSDEVVDKYPAIENYQQDSSTETTISVSWTIDVSEFTPLKYRITINELISNEFFCTTESCTYTVANLSPCNEYLLTLVAIYEIVKEDSTNPPVSITGTTAYSVPGSISDLNDNGDKITWTAPTNEQCVTEYKICYTSDYFVTTECFYTEEVEWTYNVDTISGCDSLSISVCGATADGQLGPVSIIEVATDYGVPSEPRNFEISFNNPTEILLKWDVPESNAACITDFSIVYGPAGNVTTISARKEMRQDFTATLTNLHLCTNYQIEVAAVSQKDELGPPAVDFAQTEDASPNEIPNIQVEPGTNEVTISWGNGTLDPCLDSIRICYSDPVEGHIVCELIDNGGDAYGNYSVSGLSPCRGYTFIVEGISPGGINGSYSTVISETVDVAPGPVRNLAVSTVSTTSLGVAWDAPENYADCVYQYQITYTNMAEATQMTKTVTPTARASDFEDVLDGLDPCVEYKVRVVAITETGKKSPVRETNGRTADDAPGAPRNGQVVSTTVNSVTLLFYAPDERYCVESYHARFIELEGQNILDTYYTPDPPYAEQFVHTFSSPGLTSCTDYTLQLRATNSFYASTEVLEMAVKTACE